MEDLVTDKLQPSYPVSCSNTIALNDAKAGGQGSLNATEFTGNTNEYNADVKDEQIPTLDNHRITANVALNSMMPSYYHICGEYERLTSLGYSDINPFGMELLYHQLQTMGSIIKYILHNGRDETHMTK